MKRTLSLLLLFLGLSAAAQDSYTTSDLQMIFSFANVKENGSEIESRMRWSPVFNLGTNFHNDFGDHFGFYLGLNIKNIGFIARRSTGLEIHRVYSLGIPIGIKIGNMSKRFIYSGYEIEFPFNYRFRGWEGGDRSGTRVSFNQWFSNATPKTMHTLFIGIQFYRGTNLKFKYYLDNFLNQDYTRDGIQPNAGLEAQVFSVSLVSSFLKSFKFYR